MPSTLKLSLNKCVDSASFFYAKITIYMSKTNNFKNFKSLSITYEHLNHYSSKSLLPIQGPYHALLAHDHELLPEPSLIVLPDTKFTERDNQQLLFRLMPNVQRVEFDDRILVYLFSELPAKPWPKRIAGVPCYFTSDPNDSGPLIPIFRMSRSAITISPSMDLRDNEAAVDLIFDLTRDFFINARISKRLRCMGSVVVCNPPLTLQGLS